MCYRGHLLVLLFLVAVACKIESPRLYAGADPAKPRGQSTVAGKITDASGAAVAGAKVTLYRLETSTTRSSRFKVGSDGAVTDKTGTYEIRDLNAGYFVLSVEKPGFPRTLRTATLKSRASQQADVVLKAPVSFVIHVKDQAGKPVAGATIREFTERGSNGKCAFPQIALRSLGITIPCSDPEGRLQLPLLPSGDIITLTLEHPQLAPVRTREIAVSPGASVAVTMSPGVPVTLHVPVDVPSHRIKSAVLDLRHEPFNDPSTVFHYELLFGESGTAQFTVAPGNYSWLLLEHENFFLTPVYSANHRKKNWLRIEPGRNQNLHIAVRRKISVSGRVVNADTGRALLNMSLMGKLAHGAPKGWNDAPVDQWSFAGWAQTNINGRYSLDLAEGLARVLFQGDGFVPEHEYEEVSVAADGSTVIPDIKVRPLRKIVGIVHNPDGSPSARSVVRLRGKFTNALQPVLTNDAGRFELKPLWIPSDPETGKRIVVQPIVAFDPYRPLAASGEVRLDQPQEVVLTLEPHPADWPLSQFQTDISDWERGIMPTDERSKDTAISLRGRTPPEIESVLWLNTNDQNLKLADLRGKYVFLDFWFTGCGPCHGDFPSVKLVHELYASKGVVVIGVHNNSSTPDAVREHVAKIGLPFPVAVDHPDGRTIAAFEAHGIPRGYPDYVLISPEGKVLLDDRTIPHPSLRTYKLEIIRRFVLETERTGK